MKKYCSVVLVLILIFITILTIAGCGGGNNGGGIPPIPSWNKQLGTSEADIAYGIAADGSGNVYITGYTQGGLDGNSNTGVNDIFSVKYDSSGIKQWTRQLGTSTFDTAYGVAVDNSGNVYITGYTQGGLDGNTSAGNKDIFLMKYDSAGTKQWTKQLGTSGVDIAYGVAVDGGGNVYITGETNGGLDGNTNTGEYDVFLVMYDSLGTKQWTRQFGSSYSDIGRGVAVDGSGNIYITGETVGGLDGNTNAGSYDMFLVKYNSSGAKQWTKQLGDLYSNSSSGVAVDGIGNIYIIGDIVDGLDGNTAAGDYDMCLVKYTSSGAKQWTKQLGSSMSDNAQGIAVDGSGNVYITGGTSGGLDGNSNTGMNDIFLVKYDSSGTKQWTRQLGTSTIDFAYGVAVDGSGNVYITGETSGDLDGNSNTGMNDIFLVKYDPAGVKQ